MRTILFITFFSMISLSIRGQIALETLAGNQQAHYINYIDKDLDSTAKWNFFNLNRFTVNYKDFRHHWLYSKVQQKVGIFFTSYFLGGYF